MNISQLEPQSVWSFFHQITQIPRPSKKEEKISVWLRSVAQNLGLPFKEDEVGNMVIYKPATKGMENRQGFCIQAHTDMVCEKNRDVDFDFDNDPIQTYIDGDWVKAKGTTLGADNGMGLAMGLAILASKDIAHPEFELLCTVDEETGLTGALQLSPNLLNTKLLINLDSEEDGHFTIGCAGGINTKASIEYDATPSFDTAIEIGIKGLRGGHSGIEINDGRACSNALLTRILYEIKKKIDFELISFDGGNKHNAIPREAFAKIAISEDNLGLINEMFTQLEKTLHAEWHSKEPNLKLTKQEVVISDRCFSVSTTKLILTGFMTMPHGVIRMSPDINGLVHSSTNFAVVTSQDNGLQILTSQRSLRESEKFDVARKVGASLELSGAKVNFSDGYPAWQPDIKSPLVDLAVGQFEILFGNKPVIETIHAGLECGLIGEKYPGMDMISFGPTLKEVHTPDEKISISTVERCWKLLVKIVENLPLKN